MASRGRSDMVMVDTLSKADLTKASISLGGDPRISRLRSARLAASSKRRWSARRAPRFRKSSTHPTPLSGESPISFRKTRRAAQAIQDKGTIKIHSAVVNDEVIIKVTDDGSGMSSEQMKKIFTPFYTTNPVGHGTGLGLSIARGFMDLHGGSVTIDAGYADGTCFVCQLPVIPVEITPSENQETGQLASVA